MTGPQPQAVSPTESTMLVPRIDAPVVDAVGTLDGGTTVDGVATVAAVGPDGTADGSAPQVATAPVTPVVPVPEGMPAPAVEMLTCPECGTVARVTVNRRDAADFCRSCDYPLFWTPSVVIRDRAATAGDASLRRLPGAHGRATVASEPCPHCAELNAVGARTCVRCGLPMVVVAELPPPPPPVVVPAPVPVVVPEPDGVAWWIWALLGLGTAVLVTLVILIGTGVLH